MGQNDNDMSSLLQAADTQPNESSDLLNPLIDQNSHEQMVNQGGNHFPAEISDQHPGFSTAQEMFRKLNSLLFMQDGPVNLPNLFQCLNITMTYYNNLQGVHLMQRNIVYEESFIRPFVRQAIANAFNRIMSPYHMSYNNNNNAWNTPESTRYAWIMLISMIKALLDFVCRTAIAAATTTPADGSNEQQQQQQPVLLQIPADLAEDLATPLSLIANFLHPTAHFWEIHKYDILDDSAAHAYTHANPIPIIESQRQQGEQQQQQGEVLGYTWLIDVVNQLCQYEILDSLCVFLRQPDRLDLDVMDSFLGPIATLATVIHEDKRQALIPVVNSVVLYIEKALQASSSPNGFEALEEASKSGASAYDVATKVVRSCNDIANAAGGSALAYEAVLNGVYLDIILRLLRSGNFAKQLHAVKQLGDVLSWFLFEDSDDVTSGPLLSWVEQNQIVKLVLSSNLHQQQYADPVKNVLALLLRKGRLPNEHISFLWNLTEQATTFDEIKVNTFGILGKLGPYMDSDQLAMLFSKLEERAKTCSVGDVLRIADLLVTMSEQDVSSTLAQRIIDCGCNVVLRNDAPVVLATSDYLSQICRIYENRGGGGGGNVQHQNRYQYGITIIKRLEHSLETSPDIVAAVFVFNNLLSNVYSVEERMRELMTSCNEEAKLLKKLLVCYRSFLAVQYQRIDSSSKDDDKNGEAPHPSASSPRHLEIIPSIGEFSHYQAVGAWFILLWSIIRNGNFFVTKSQLEEILSWITTATGEGGGVFVYDISKVWTLLCCIVCGRHEVTERDAALFFKESLCTLDPTKLSEFHGWRCFTAYLTALGSWRDPLQSDATSEQMTSQLRLSNANVVCMDFLWQVVLQGPPIVSSAASRLLAFMKCQYPLYMLAAQQSQEEVEGEEQQYNQHCTLEQRSAMMMEEVKPKIEQLAEDAAVLCGGALPDAWYLAGNNGSSLLRVPSSTSEIIATTCMRTQRILVYLNLLINEGRMKSMPLHPSHAAAYREFPIPLQVSIQHLPLLAYGNRNRNNNNNNSSSKKIFNVPSNLYVGTLRIFVAKEYGDQVSPEYIRLLGPGRDYSNDGSMLVEERIHDNTQLIGSIIQQPNGYSYPQNREELELCGPASIISSHHDAIYAHLLELCDDARYGNEVAAAARNLLNSLPTCQVAVNDIKQLLSLPQGGQQLKQLLTMMVVGDDDDDKEVCQVNHGVLLYVLQVLCTLLLPSENVAWPSQTVMTVSWEDSVAHCNQCVLSGCLKELLGILLSDPGIKNKNNNNNNNNNKGGGMSSIMGLACHRSMLLLLNLGCSAFLNIKATSPGDGDGSGDNDEAAAASSAEWRILWPLISAYYLHAMQTLAQYGSPDNENKPKIRQLAARMEGDISLLCSEAMAGLQTLLSLDSRVMDVFYNDSVDNADADVGAMRAKIKSILLISPSELVIRTVNTLLDSPIQALRDLGATHMFFISKSSESSHSWVLQNIVFPLLLLQDTNMSSNMSAEEVELCVKIIRTMNDDEIVVVGRDMMAALLGQVKMAIKDTAPMNVSALLLTALLEQMGGEVGVEDADKLVTGIITEYLFPELCALNVQKWSKIVAIESSSGNGRGEDKPGIDEAALQLKALKAAQCVDTQSREAAFSLIHHLILHDTKAFNTGDNLLRKINADADSIFLSRWRNFGLPNFRQQLAYTGLVNGGATCYMNSIFQQLYMQPTIRRLILSAQPVDEEERKDSVFHQVQMMFAHLLQGVEPAYRPRSFWEAFKDYDGMPVNIKLHQDAHEFFTQLQDTLDEGLKARGQPKAIYAALGGAFAQLITPLTRPDLRSYREEEFYQIQLDVRGKRDLIESLESLVQPELLNGTNQYYCEQLDAKVDAEKRSLIARLPSTLVFQLKRFEFDHETHQRLKIKDRFEFPMDLNVKRFTLEGNSEDGGGTSAAAAAAAAAAATTTTATAPSTTCDEAKYQYQLCGIVVHSGTAFAGHYYSYIKERGPNGRWYCFDDTSVDVWNPATINAECFGGRYIPEGTQMEYDRPNSAYMLFYERKHDSSDENNAVWAKVGEQPKLWQQQGGGHQPPSSSRSSITTTLSTTPMAPEIAALLTQSNLKTIANSHLLGPDYHSMMNLLILELKNTVLGSLPRKVAKSNTSEGDDGGAGPSLNDKFQQQSALLQLADRRSSEVAYLTSKCYLICLDYIIRILCHSSTATLENTIRKKQNWMKVITAVMKNNRHTVVMFYNYIMGLVGFADTGQMFASIVGQSPPLLEVAPYLSTWVFVAAESMVNDGSRLAYTRLDALITWVVDKVLIYLHDNKAKKLAPGLEAVGILGRIAHLEEDDDDDSGSDSDSGLTSTGMVRALLDKHLEAMVSLAPTIADTVSRDPNDNHKWFLVSNYLKYLSCTVRKWSLLEENDPNYKNPFCLVRKSPEGTAPSEVVEAFFGVEDTLLYLLTPSCFNSVDNMRLLQWMMWHNDEHRVVIVDALLAHIKETSDDWYDLAPETCNLRELLTTYDSLSEERTARFLLGSRENDVPGLLQLAFDVDNTRSNQSNLVGLALIWLVAGLCQTFPETAQNCLGGWSKNPTEWATWAHEFVTSVGMDLKGGDRVMMKEWEAVGAEEFVKLMDWDELGDVLKIMGAEEMDLALDSDVRTIQDGDEDDNVDSGSGGSGGRRADVVAVRDDDDDDDDDDNVVEIRED